jgi:lipoprotein signal peptidase
MAQRTFRAWVIVLAFVGFTLDQASKYGVFRWLYEHPQHYHPQLLYGDYVLIPGAFRLLAQYEPRSAGDFTLRTWNADKWPRVNHGALFGLGIEHETSANLFFATISLLAAGAIIYWSTRPSAGPDRWLCITLGIILGGTLGNLYDRLVFNGVRDFLHFKINGVIDWPVFNIADCCLVCGAGLLLLQAFWAPVTETKDAAPSGNAVPAR